jgi:hypothetical protein
VDVLQVGEAALAKVTFLGIEFNLSSPVLPPLPATPASGSYSTTIMAQVVNGTSSVQTSLPIAGSGASGGDSSVEMNSLTTNSTALISVYQNVRLSAHRHQNAQLAAICTCWGFHQGNPFT